MGLVHRFALSALASLFLVPSAVAQTGGYAVTATLSPFFIKPGIAEGLPLQPIDGLVRGADG